MPLLFFGFLFVLMSLLWVVWTLTLLFWPVALLVVGCLFLRGQMRRQHMTGGLVPYRAAQSRAPSGRNAAFEEYRAATLNRLDEEAGKFREFLQRMRSSRDSKEFEAFMAARRGRPAITQGDASTI